MNRASRICNVIAKNNPGNVQFIKCTNGEKRKIDGAEGKCTFLLCSAHGVKYKNLLLQ